MKKTGVASVIARTEGAWQSLVTFIFSLLLIHSTLIFASSKELDNAVQNISEQIAQSVKTSGESVAIPPFLTFDNKTTALGKMLSEKLISRFADSPLERGGRRGDRGVLIPVERDFIFKLTDEMKLGMTGLVEPKTVQQVGKFSGASYVLVGTIQKVGKDIQVNSRLVRTETSKVEKSVETTLKASPEILELLSQEIKTPLIPVTEHTEQQKLMRTDFDKLRKDYGELQDELEKLKEQMAQAKDEKTKVAVQKKQRQTEKELTASEYFSKGYFAGEMGNYSSAVENWTQAIEINPNYAEAYYNRGVGYFWIGDNVRSIPDLSRAIELNPKNAYAYAGLGLSYAQIEDDNRAISNYSKAIELNLKKAILYYVRGLSYAKIGDNVRAFSDYNKAIEINPELAYAYYDRGRAYYNMGDNVRAISDCNKAIEINPKYATAYVIRGVAYGEMGDSLRAISDYNRAIEINPKLAQAYHNRGSAYYKRGQISAAKRDFQKACDLGTDRACDALDKLQW